MVSNDQLYVNSPSPAVVVPDDDTTAHQTVLNDYNSALMKQMFACIIYVCGVCYLTVYSPLSARLIA